MATFLYTHRACLEHDTGYGHPESSARLKAVLEELAKPCFKDLVRRAAPRADHGQLARVHESHYIASVFKAVPAAGDANLAPDTLLSPGSGEAALRAAGSVCAAVDAVATGMARNAFCAVRPPGHHAGPGSTMGFCLFNNAAVGVLHARVAHGMGRVAVVDFDVHHGNGTQAIFRRDAGVFFASIHQSFTFPKSGGSDEVGVGNIVNVPMVRSASGAKFRRALEDKILPRLRQFAPDLLILSAGFDAHVRDPLGELKLMTADYAEITRAFMDAADGCCGGRVVSVLEGGYNPEALAHAVGAHVSALLAV